MEKTAQIGVSSHPESIISGAKKLLSLRFSNQQIFAFSVVLCVLGAGILSLIIPNKYEISAIVRIGYLPTSSEKEREVIWPLEDPFVIRENLLEKHLASHQPAYISDIKILNRTAAGSIVEFIASGPSADVSREYLKTKVTQIYQEHTELYERWKKQVTDQLASLKTKTELLTRDYEKILSGPMTASTSLLLSQYSNSIQATIDRTYRLQILLSSPTMKPTHIIRQDSNARRVQPNPTLYLLLGLFLGICFGISAVAFRNWLKS